jgi:hypothetical protein
MSRPINFQNLPSTTPNALPPKGIYVYEIESAQVRCSANTGNDYLEIKAKLSKGDGKKVATIFDRIFDIDSDIPRYKLRQFIVALRLPITGDFQLSDLTKMIVGKKILADITHEKSKDPRYADKAVVDPFSAEIYYPISRAEELLGTSMQSADSTAAINASDAEDIDY